jgi:pimeloyl-ACP methyl ester carboxylesterase
MSIVKRRARRGIQTRNLARLSHIGTQARRRYIFGRKQDYWGKNSMPRVINDGVAIHYRIDGDGSPLVLQHGFTDSSTSWYELWYVDALKSRHRLILPDTRGHGQSDKPHNPLAYTAVNFAADITAVLDHAGLQQASYWGYSQGGWIAFTLARHAANRIASFVIGGASASSLSAYPTEPGKEDPLLAAPRRGSNEVVKLYGEWVTPALEKRLLGNDTAALIACRQQRLGSCPLTWCKSVVGHYALRRGWPVCQSATADRLTMELSLRGAMVSSVI